MRQVVGVYKKFSVHWGGFSILKCEMFLMREAFENCDAMYFHLISGQDYPVYPLNYFLGFFEKHKGLNYIQYVHLPHPQWDNNTYSRLQYYYLYDFSSNKEKGKNLSRKFVSLQKKFGIKRRIPDCFDHLYGNSQWFSITKDAVNKLLEYTEKHPNLYKRLRMTFAPEEIYISTVLVNIIPKEKIHCNSLRYIRWHFENGNIPANLGNEHLTYLLRRNYLFARKFEENCSEGLQSIIKETLHNEKELRITESGKWIYDGYIEYDYNELFVNVISQICRELKVKSILDVGCGAGLYVDAFREQGFHVSGIDSNPYTELLSSQILVGESGCCKTFDVLQDENDGNKYNMVICKDVLPYIPMQKILEFVRKIVSFSQKYILINFFDDKNSSSPKYIRLCRVEITQLLNSFDFVYDEELTNIIAYKLNNFINPFYFFKSYAKEKIII